MIKHFKELNKSSIPVAGGKGAQLGEMFNLGLPVPEGFVVTADAYKHFLEHNNLFERIKERLDVLDVENTEALDAIAEEIQKLIIEGEMPKTLIEDIKKFYNNKFVAVRSSATAEDLPEASFAGQQSTFLNVNGEDFVVQAVQKCFASLFTARAIYYRHKNKFDHMKVLIAVVVQDMVDAEKAGVVFTVNPVTNDKSELIIEAAFGLGEAVVAGELTPDNYLVAKETMKIIEKTVNKQDWAYKRKDGETVKVDIFNGEDQKLTDEEILQLTELSKKIENHYGSPQDIEFAVADKIYILQSRPITTLR